MEKLEPTLFENAVTRLTNSDNMRIRKFAEEKVQSLGIEKDQDNEKKEVRTLAARAASDTEDSDLLSISPEKLIDEAEQVAKATGSDARIETTAQTCQPQDDLHSA
jgi:hypothetical protein